MLEYLRHKLTARLLLPLNSHLSLTLTGRYQDRTGNYTDTTGNVNDYKPYGVADARLSWRDTRYCFYVEGNNLTGSHFVDFGNVRQPGLWVIGGVEIKM